MKEQIFMEISRDDFEKAKHNGAYSLIGDAIKQKYLVTDAQVHTCDGRCYLSYKKGFPFGKGGKR